MGSLDSNANGDLNLVPENLRWASDIIMTMYYAVVGLVLINLLIAIINRSYSYYTSYNQEENVLNNEAILLIEKYNIIEYIQRYFKNENLEHRRLRYCSVKYEKDFETKQKVPNYYFVNHDLQKDWITNNRSSTSFESSNDIMNSSLFIIDPQIDFHPGGSLAVPGANEDSERIASMIMNNKESIHEIFVSLDSHYPTHIAHAIFWEDAEGNHPAPFTVVNYSDVRDEVWIPVDKSPEVRQWCLYYTKSLERKGKFKLTIWPEHCIIGSRGHCIVPVINKALQAWAEYSKRPVNYIMKGQNCRTEMFSALVAEVEDPLDSSTSLNHNLLSMLRVADRVSNDAIDYLIFFNL